MRIAALAKMRPRAILMRPQKDVARFAGVNVAPPAPASAAAPPGEASRRYRPSEPGSSSGHLARHLAM